MKCPKCNYTSFDNLANCKKCGFMLKEGTDSDQLAAFKATMYDDKTGGDEVAEAKKPPDISETVTSIKSSLDEIEAGEPESTKDLPKEQTGQVGNDVAQVQRDEAPVEEGKKFPSFDKVDWGKGVSLSSDELNVDIDDLTGEEGEREEKTREIRFADESGETDKRTLKLKEELGKAGEELRQIEEEPAPSEPAYPPPLPDEGFDLSTVKKGGFWIRLGAYIIDGIILNVLASILTFIGVIALGLGPSGLEGIEELESGGVLSFILPLYIFMIILNIAYYTYFHGSTGQTLGKMVCRLKVVRLSGEPLGYGKAFLRWIGYIPSSIFLLGFLWVAWDKHKQAWHDKIAGTCVIRI